MSWDREELIGLGVLLAVVLMLVFTGHLTQQAVDSLKWLGGAFMASKGAQGVLPGNKQ